MFDVIKDRVLLVVKEIANLLTNTIIPIVGLVILITELLPIPKMYIAYLKTLEYYLFYAAGTADDIKKGIKEKF